MRTQAHIEKVVKTYSIEGADRVEMAQILDYHVLVQKGEFSAGELAVYVEVDTILPDGLSKEKLAELRAEKILLKAASKDDKPAIQAKIDEIISHNTIPEFEFLRAKDFEIHTLKNKKLGIYSLGIMFPMSILKLAYDRLSDELKPKFETIINSPKEGMDVSTLIGAVKIDEDEIISNIKKPIHPLVQKIDKKLMSFSLYRTIKKKVLPKKLSGDWPSDLPHQSDEDSAQKVFTRFKAAHGHRTFYMTEKLEGQNIGIFKKLGKKFFGLLPHKRIGVCSHHRYIRSPDGSGFWETTIKLGFHNTVMNMVNDMFIRGEHCGPGIQDNIYNFSDRRIYFFEVYHMDTKQILNYDNFIAFCNTWNLPTVPVLDDNFKLPDTIDELLKIAHGMSVLGTKPMREGIILRCKEDPSISIKVRDPIYMEAHKPKKKTPIPNLIEVV